VTPPNERRTTVPETRKRICAPASPIRRGLLRHFDQTRRELPWRSARTPYRVLVSEVMLQQTRAETAAPYYERWLRRFPGWKALAAASRDDVLLAWKGLGYYARATNLHRTASVVRDRHGGRLPRDPAVLRTLPGVGEYTAGAVASIAFGVPVPAVDGNVRRVLSRLLDAPRPSARRIHAEATRLLDPERPGDFNEALMELGATVCTPKSPRCGACPLAAHCRARAAGTAEERPAPPRAPRVRRAEFAVAVAVDKQGRTLLVRRPEVGLLAGMWEFPATELGDAGPAGSGDVGDGRNGNLAASAAEAALARLAGPGLAVRGKVAGRLRPVRHAFTHLRAVYHPVVVTCDREALDRATDGVGGVGVGGRNDPADAPRATVAASLDDLAGLAVPVAQQKIAAQLAHWLGDRSASRQR